MDIDFKVKVNSACADVAFGILYIDPNSREQKFFGGFFNEIERIGTENETQCWEQEEWVDDLDVGIRFNTLTEAKDTLDVLVEYRRKNCSIVLYGRGDIPSIDGTNWFPLKTFVCNVGGEHEDFNNHGNNGVLVK